MPKRTPTEAQKAVAEAKRAKFAEVATMLASMTDAQRAEMAAKIPAIVTCEGHVLSLHNMLMIAYQCKDATMVGGYRQWQKTGRQVKRGEHGLLIWSPKFKKESDASEETHSGYITVTVFDVSQTEELTNV